MRVRVACMRLTDRVFRGAGHAARLVSGFHFKQDVCSQVLLRVALLCPLAALPVSAQASSWDVEADAAFRRGAFAEVTRLAQRKLDQQVDAGQARAWLGQVAAAGNEHSMANSHFESARDAGVSLSGFAESWAQALTKLGRGKEACRVLTEAFDNDSSAPHLAYSAGACYLSEKDPYQAVELLQRAYDSGIRHTAAVLALARASLEVGREDAAIDLLAPLTTSTTSHSLLLKIGRLLFERSLYRQSVETLNRAWRLKTGDTDTGTYLALAHYLLEEYEEALQVLTAIKTPYLSAEYRYLIGSVHARLGEWDQAQQQLELGVAADPERAGGYLNLGLFHLERGDLTRAMELLEKGSTRLRPGTKLFYVIRSRTNCVGTEPPRPNAEPDLARGQFYSNLAKVLLERQQWGSALEVYLLSLKMNPSAPEPYGGVGLICQELGTPEVGLVFLEAGLRLHPENPDLHYYTGSLHEFLGNPSKALESYKEAIRLRGSQSPALYWVRLGVAQRASGETASAESSFQQALRQDADSSDAHYQLGKLYLATRRFDPAEQFLEKAVRLAPSMQEAYYAYGMACMRNGKAEKGRRILESHRRKQAIRNSRLRGMGNSSDRRSSPETQTPARSR